MRHTILRRILIRNVLLSICALSCTIFIGMFFLYKFTIAKTIEVNQRSADIVSQRVDNFMYLALERAKFISKDSDILNKNYLTALEIDFKIAQVYDSICVLNNKGEAITSFPQNEVYGNSVILKKQKLLTNLQINIDKRHLVIFAPVKKQDGTIDKYLGFNMDLIKNKFFNDLLNSLSDQIGGVGYIIDEKGRILFHHDKSKIGEMFPMEFLTENRKIRFNNNKDVLTSFAKVPQTHWYVIKETPYQAVLNPLYQFAVILIGFFVFIFLLYTLVSYYLLKGALRPIRELIREMSDISALDYYEPLQAKGVGEVAYLYQAYNVMIDRLKQARKLEQETFEELKRAEKLSVVGELAAGSAHEIRNPLTTIKGFIQLFYQTGKTMSPEYKELLFSELERIELITNEFLMLAKPQMETMQIYKLKDLVEQACILIENDARLWNIEVINQAKCECVIYCDVAQIKQVFLNICRNAIQAMADGGKLVIQCINNNNNGTLIKFTDTGPGIAKENLDKLGQPFFTTKPNGTGLGLMVSYRIVQNHHGKIDVKSGPKGTTFSIWLPMPMESNKLHKQ